MTTPMMRCMSVALAAIAVLGSASTLLLTSGCGGAGSRDTASGAARATNGRATFTVRWPERSRLIPFAAESIRVSIHKGDSVLGEALLTRPTSGGTATANFDRLPTGNALVTATALPNADGTGVAQAKADIGVNIVAGQTTPVNLTMASTIDHDEVTPAIPSLAVGDTMQLAATAKDATGAVVLTSTSTIGWESKNTAIATVDYAGRVTGIAIGTTVIEATEKESDEVGSVNVSIGIAPSPSPTPTPTPTPTPGTPHIISLVTNDLAYDAVSNRIYVSVPSSVGTNGNSICAINPSTQAVGSPVFVGSEPGGIRITDDGQFLYVVLNGAAAVRRFDLGTQTAGLQISLGNRSARDLELIHGYPHRFIVIRHDGRFSPPGGVDTAIYDDDVPLDQTIAGVSVIETNETGTRLYGYDGDTSGFGFLKQPLANGTWADGGQWGAGMINRYGVDITYGGGRVYANTGTVIDPEQLIVVGSIPGGTMRPDPGHNLVFVMTGGDSVATIRAFNTTTFLQVASLDVKNLSGGPTGKLILWGDRGLAFRTSGGQVVILDAAPGL
jgi:hypothetical protein